MFYYPNVLQRPTGCFSTIWLAATRGTRVTRRQFLKVNVNQTCSEIVDYVTAQVPAPLPNQPNPRFSLYLSSQLQYGVVVVYHRQCAYLLDEIQQIVNRLLRTKRGLQIDMAEADRMTLDLPDGMIFIEEDEGAHDPFFGLMKSQKLPSPSKIHHVEFIIVDPDVRRSVDLSSQQERFVSPRAAITMTEKEPVVIDAAECFQGDDLLEPTAEDIDFLMDQPDQFQREVNRRKTEDGTSNQEVVSSLGPLKDTSGMERDSDWLPDQQTSQVALAAVAVEMTPPRVAMPSEVVRVHPAGSPREEVAPPPRKRQRGRKRQLVFADPKTQISDEAMKEQIGNPQTETQDLNKVLVALPALTRASPAQLFCTPCCKSLIQMDLLSLWKRRSSLAVLLRSEEMESKRELETPLNESGPQSSEGSVLDLKLDGSKGDRSDLLTPVHRWSPPVDIQPPMEPIMEEPIEMPEAQSEMEDRNSSSWFPSALQQRDEVTFGSVLPPEADRLTAAQKFYKLLELLTDKQLAAHQTKPYDDIVITSGGGVKMVD